MTSHLLTVGLAQIAPAWLDREAGVAKIVEWIDKAGKESCDLVSRRRQRTKCPVR